MLKIRSVETDYPFITIIIYLEYYSAIPQVTFLNIA